MVLSYRKDFQRSGADPGENDDVQGSVFFTIMRKYAFRSWKRKEEVKTENPGETQLERRFRGFLFGVVL
ncbi:hypothetical protein ANCDUO_05047 [Ancylostoma duodenale]|uniref:Uncharacterized protein n=1 Tax=Ancylostoma duodenale TaxID=51022 RepID=A0A0C2GZI7_9BILA|nr:hypothetical protein ANCDUO_05047 [Ancylostoma duodenale]